VFLDVLVDPVQVGFAGSGAVVQGLQGVAAGLDDGLGWLCGVWLACLRALVGWLEWYAHGFLVRCAGWACCWFDIVATGVPEGVEQAVRCLAVARDGPEPGFRVVLAIRYGFYRCDDGLVIGKLDGVGQAFVHGFGNLDGHGAAPWVTKLLDWWVAGFWYVWGYTSSQALLHAGIGKKKAFLWHFVRIPDGGDRMGRYIPLRERPFFIILGRDAAATGYRTRRMVKP
jgi:hypothetical protein